MNVLRIFESLLSGTVGSIKSVFRHKQRSFSLIAGMILGAGILGGILIYTDIVNEANFNSIVHGVDYEVRFDLKQAPTAQDNYSMASISKNIKANPLVDDAVIMYGQSRQKIVQTSTSYSQYTSTLRAQFPSENTNAFSASSIFGTQAFLLNQSDVGSSKIINVLSKNVFEGTFNLSDRGVVIPQTLADTNQLQVGSVTNITLYISDGGSSLGAVAQYNLTNAVITGIYRSSTGGNLLTSILNSEKIYASINEVKLEHPELISKLNKEEMGFIAVKINPDKLTLSDSSKANSEIDQFMNEIEKEYPGILIGTNEISNALLGSQVFSGLILLFDLFLTLPVFILGIYLITFGAQMALDDRKKEIAIYKIQGASAQQIMKSIFGEITILVIIGSILGYGISVLVGLSNSLAIGYGKFDFGPNFSKLFTALSYLKFNIWAYAIILIFGGGILLFIGYHGSKGFIEAEIASTLYKTTENTQGFAFRYWIDYILFGWGSASLLKNLANQYIFPPGHGLDLGIYGLIIDIPGAIFFWLGGALVISRLSRVIPAKLDKYILKLRFLSDVRVMIFADLRRRTVNTSKIALIIALAISFAALASVQGTTHEMNIDRQVGWEVGADLQMKFMSASYGSIMESYFTQTLNVNGIQSALPLGKLNGQVLNDPVTVFYTDSQQYAKSPYMQSDALNSGSFSSLSGNYKINALVGSSVLSAGVLKVGENINLGVNILHYNGTGFSTSEVTTQIHIVGSLSHTPGGVNPGSIFVDYRFIQNLYNATPTAEFNAYNNVPNANVVGSLLHVNITSTMLDNYYPADTYLIQTSTNADTVQADILSQMGSFASNIFDSYTYKSKLADARDLSSSGFGIAGLLTAMFFISLLSATIGTFIFISLVVRSRSKEFAILRAVGATERQIYKIALSEVISVLIFALIAGTILGLGLAYMFNGFFSFLAVFSGTLSYNVPRRLIFPWDTIFYSGIITAVIIIIATILPTRRVANQEIIEETRQI